MAYVDGFVLAVPTANKEAYRALAEQAAAIYRAHGALQVIEAWGNDVPEGVLTSFPMAVRRGPDETVVFAWILWPSKEARDAGNAAAMADPSMQLGDEPPFDPKRMIFGGFEALVNA
jgi:uncharacterized protein YbaA (DUF1428 family)